MRFLLLFGRFVLRAFVAATALLALACGANAQDLFVTKARQAYMIEAETGSILLSKNPDEEIPPASLAKLMTMEVVFHAIETGKLKLTDQFVVSENAWRKGGAPSGGSTMFAKLKSSIALSDLVQAVIVQSANDGCIVIAEGVAGSEENFAKMMTERARVIGLKVSEFKNATGLPADGQKVTMRELVALAQHIWREYPQFWHYYSQKEFTWNDIKQKNRNPLLALDIGAEGMKTGFTEASGYAIVGVVQRGGKRVFVAMSGLQSEQERAEEARKMLEWGVSAFDKIDIFAGGEVLGDAKVYGGSQDAVPVVAKGPIALYVPITNRDRLKARVIYNGPIPAPVAAGQEVGVFRVWIGDTISQEIPVFAAKDVETGPIHKRALDAVEELMTGWLRS